MSYALLMEDCLPCDVEEQPLIPPQLDKLEKISFAAQKYKTFNSWVLSVAQLKVVVLILKSSLSFLFTNKTVP